MSLTVGPRPRQWIGGFAGLLVCAASGCGGVQWHYRVEPAMQRAAQFNQLVLVDFRSWTDYTCNEADDLLFRNNDVLKVLKDYQCVELDYALNKSLADRLGVTIVPTYVVLRPDGTLVDRRAGRLDADEFRAFLKWAPMKR